MRPVPAGGGDAAFAAPVGGGLRARVFEIFEEGDSDTGWGRLVEFALIGLIVSNVIMVILESVPSIYQPNRTFFHAFEYATVYIFAAEYALRLWSSVEDPRIDDAHPLSGRLKFAARPMMVIDLLAFAPFFVTAVTGGIVDLRALRVLRLLRLLKLTRYVQGVSALLSVVYAERRALVGTGILLVCTVCFTGEVMRVVEGPSQPQAFGTLPGAMWWAILTISTVGYGDVTPHTMVGKLVAGLTMVWGLMLYAMPIGIISKGFLDSLHRRQFSITWSMMTRQALFADLGVEAIGQIMDRMDANLIADHARIAVAGAPAQTFSLIVSGRAVVEEETATLELGAGDMIGEEAIVEDACYRRTVIARSDVRLISLPGEELPRLARRHPLLAGRVRGEAVW